MHDIARNIDSNKMYQNDVSHTLQISVTCTEHLCSFILNVITPRYHHFVMESQDTKNGLVSSSLCIGKSDSSQHRTLFA